MTGLPSGKTADMAIDEETLARIREVLNQSDRVAAGRVAVDRAGDEVVLSGAVATPEEATAAALLAEQQAPAVRNEIRVDTNLREDPADPRVAGDTVTRDPDAAAREVTSADTSTPDHRSNQTGSAALDHPPGDQPTDVEAALGENLPWDPPDEPSLAPTRQEQRGMVDRDITEVEPAGAGPVDEADELAPDEEPSAADLSAAELARSARGRDGSEEET